MSAEWKVLSVLLVVWVGLFLYLLHLDREVRKIKDRQP
ncbi:MAG: hypothetical protein FD129_235 [bacterium]|nr:MAG: hypothetical protein FD129_235 [bacterium]